MSQLSETPKLVRLPGLNQICAFCGAGEKQVDRLFMGITGRCICDTCVGYVREKMGLVEPVSPELQKILDTPPDAVA